jgi:hypothetical protein
MLTACEVGTCGGIADGGSVRVSVAWRANGESGGDAVLL